MDQVCRYLSSEAYCCKSQYSSRSADGIAPGEEVKLTSRLESGASKPPHHLPAAENTPVLHQTGTIAASQLNISVVFKMMNILDDDTLELNSAQILNI